MEFGARSDIGAPIGFVFDQITDFRAIERAAMRRGAEVQRVDTLTAGGPGMAWDASFDLRGRRREMQLELTEYTPPDRLVIASRSPALGGGMVVELVALSRTRTRMTLNVKLHPKTLSARLLVQSLKLARKTLRNRMDERMAAYSARIEARYDCGG